VRDGTAVVVDPMLAVALEQVERRVERLGFRVVDVAGVPLDEERLAVALWPPRLDVDRAALDREDRTEAAEALLTSTLVPVRALVLWQADPEDDGSPAQRLVNVTRLVAPSGGAPAAVTDLALARRLMTTWNVCPCSGEDGELFRLLRDLAGP
jgi:hypothetical protein